MRVTYRALSPSLEEQTRTTKNPFFFDVRITGEFTVSAEMPEEQIGPFVKAGGLLVVWPFLRQAVADLSVKLGFPPLLLPLFTFPLSSSGVGLANNTNRSPQSN